MSLIVVEGMDNSGKTTLIKTLMKETGLKGVFRKNRAYDLKGGMSMIKRSFFSSELKIHDRHIIISEMVYGPILRGKSLFGDQSWDLLSYLLKTYPIIIYCRPPTRKILDFGTREQMEGVITQANHLISRYDWVFDIVRKSFTLPEYNFFEYDYTDKDADKKLKKIIDNINHYSGRTPQEIQIQEDPENGD